MFLSGHHHSSLDGVENRTGVPGPLASTWQTTGLLRLRWESVVGPSVSLQLCLPGKPALALMAPSYHAELGQACMEPWIGPPSNLGM